MPSFDAFARDMRIVTNEELLGVREFEASPAAVALSMDEEGAGGTNDGENGTATPSAPEPEDLGDDVLAWQMPGLAELDDMVTLASAEQASYLGGSSTGADPTANIGVAGIATDVCGGIRPTADTLVFKDVFSDTRMRTIVTREGTVMFRIASVGYGSEARSRLVYSINTGSTWGEPHVIPFEVYGVDGVARQDLYDYDLAVTQVGFWGTYLYVMLVSGTRPQGDDTTFATASSQTVISILRLYDSNAEGDDPLRVSSAISWSPKGAAKYASFSPPCLQAYEDRNSFDRETNSCVIGTCLVSTASTAEGLVKPGATRGLMRLFFEHRRNEAPVVITKYAKIPVGGVTRLVMSPIAFDSALESCVRAERRHACVGCVTSSGCYVEKIEVATADNARGFTISLGTVVAPDSGEDIQRLYATGRDGEFYAIRRTQDAAADGSGIRYDGRLCLASFDTAAQWGSFSLTQAGPDSCTPTELAMTKDGRYLYYLVNKEGKTGQEFSDTGDAGNPTERASYRIMALARVEGTFSKPFTLCELEHPVDFVVSMASSGTTATLLAATVTDAEHSRADIYDIRIPLVVCATPLSLATEGPFAFAGEQSTFNVRIRNDGNTIVSALTLALYDEQTGQKVDSAALSFESDALLVPGMSATYRASFAIPDGWSGKKTLRAGIDNDATVIIQPEFIATALDANSADDNPLQDFSDEDAEWLAFLLALVLALYENPFNDFDLGEGDQPRAQISVVDGQAFANYGDLIALGESDQTSKKVDPSGPESGGGSSGGSSGSGPSKALPDTGDEGLLDRLARTLGM